MHRQFIISLLLLAAFLTAGCASMGRNARSGALLGTALGAGAGAIVGHQSGHRSAGAAIGAGLGALTGGLIGSAIDRSEEEAEDRARETDARVERALHEAGRNGGRLSVLDVIRMSQAGISDDLIMTKMDQTGSYYDLSASEIIDLTRSSVSERVIAYMLRPSRSEPALGATESTGPDRPEYAWADSHHPRTLPISVGFSYCR
jgi:uncharacterized protein YcfJ